MRYQSGKVVRSEAAYIYMYAHVVLTVSCFGDFGALGRFFGKPEILKQNDT